MTLKELLEELAKIGIVIPILDEDDKRIPLINALLYRNDIDLESRITTVHPAYSLGELMEREAHEEGRQI